MKFKVRIVKDYEVEADSFDQAIMFCENDLVNPKIRIDAFNVDEDTLFNQRDGK